MGNALLASLAILLVAPSSAIAQGLNLGWKGPTPGSECPSRGVVYKCDPCKSG